MRGMSDGIVCFEFAGRAMSVAIGFFSFSMSGE